MIEPRNEKSRNCSKSLQRRLMKKFLINNLILRVMLFVMVSLLAFNIMTAISISNAMFHSFRAQRSLADSHHQDITRAMPPNEKGLGELDQNTLTIALISNNRIGSLRRLCNSLLSADYSTLGLFFIRVDLVFNLEASSDDSIVEYAMDFVWPHGLKHVRKRSKQGGLILAVSESWFPSTNQDYGCLLEDDIEVSPHYLQWLTKVFLALEQDPDPRVIGISLYSPRKTETTNPPKSFNATAIVGKLLGAGHSESPYMMQTPCSWGAVYFPKHWKEFKKYMNLRLAFLSEGGQYLKTHVEIPHSRTNGWSESWKKYHFELLYLRGQYLVYPNFLGQHSLSTNHMEKGVHIVAKKTKSQQAEFEVPLLLDGSSIAHLTLNNISALPVLNLFGEPWLREAELHSYLKTLTTDGVPKRNSPRREVPNIMNVGDQLHSSWDKILMSSSTIDRKGARSFYGVLQKDGQFVIYRGSGNNAKAVWSTETFQGEKDKISYSFSLVETGSLHLEQIKEAGESKGKKSLLWYSPPDTDFMPLGSDSYKVVLERDGNLVVYRTGPRFKVVWQANKTLAHSSGSTKPTENIDIVCQKFPWAVSKLLQETSTFTLLISTHHRFKILAEMLSHYSASPLVSTIVVTWHLMDVEPPQLARIGGTHIRFNVPSDDNLSNRFQPLPYISTEAVLVLDDDIKVHLQDLHNLFIAWRQNKHNVVGFFPRFVDVVQEGVSLTSIKASAGQTTMKYLPDGEDTTNPRAGYSFMLTKGMMMHQDFLTLYTCGGEANPPSLSKPAALDNFRTIIQTLVRKELNCEDIGMNFLANAAMLMGHGPKLDAVPLFIKALHKIGDFGKISGAGLHQKSSHISTRTRCVNEFNSVFWEMMGQNLPMQTRMIDVVADASNGRSASLSVSPSRGHVATQHVDCIDVNPEGWSENSCSFQKSQRADWQGNYRTSVRFSHPLRSRVMYKYNT